MILNGIVIDSTQKSLDIETILNSNGGQGISIKDDTGLFIKNAAGSNSVTLTASGTTELTVTGAVKISSLTSSRIVYSGPGGLLSDSSNLTFNPVDVVPIPAGDLGGYSSPTYAFVSGNYAYVADGGGNNFTVVDISNPAIPVQVGILADGGGSAPYLNSPRSVYVSGNYAYVASFGSNALEIIDISNPSSPTHVSSLLDGGGSAPYLSQADSVFVNGNYAYVVGINALEIVDISNIAIPTHAGSLLDGVGGAAISLATGVYVVGNYAYISSFLSGALEIVDVSSPTSPVHAGKLLDGGGIAPYLRQATSVAVSGNYAYVTSLGYNALEVVDISNPANPVHAASILDGGGFAPFLNNPKAVFISGNYAYVVSIVSQSLEIIDISNPLSPVHAASIIDGYHGALLNSPQSVFVSNDYAYIASQGEDVLEIIQIDIQSALSINGSINTNNLSLNSLTSGQVVFAGPSGLLTDSANLTFNGSNLAVSGSITSGSLTSGQVIFAGASGLLTDSPNLTFNGADLVIAGIGQLFFSGSQGTIACAGTASRPYINLYPNSDVDITLGGFGGGTAFRVYDSNNVNNFSVTDSGSVSATNITDSALTSGQVVFAGASGLLTDSSNLTFDGTFLIANSIKNSALTSGQVVFAGASGLLTDSVNLTFDGTTLTTIGNIHVSSNLTTNNILPYTSNNVIKIKTDGGFSLASSDGTVGLQKRIIHVNTTNATPAVLTFDGTAASSSNIPTIGVSETHGYTVTVTARDTTNNLTVAFVVIRAILERTPGGTVNILASAADQIYLSNGSIIVAALADDTNKGLNIQVTGLTSTDITWNGDISETAI